MRNRIIDIMLHGQVDTNFSSSIREYDDVGSIVGSSMLDGLRSAMMIFGIKYIEMAFIGQFNKEGKYCVYVFHEVHKYSDNSIGYEIHFDLYVSDIVYQN